LTGKEFVVTLRTVTER